MGGDFNLKPEVILGADFSSRSGTPLLAPQDSTYRTLKAGTTIDYCIVSQCLPNKLHQCQVIEGSPLKPHLPVAVSVKVGQLEWTPVLEMPST